MSNDVVIKLSNAVCSRQDRHIFNPVSLSVGWGQVHQIQGPNGSGKSTLLRAMAGLIPLSAGEIRRNSDVAYLGHKLALAEHLTLNENLDLLLIDKADGERAAILSEFGLSSCLNFLVRELSAGQRQRLALARVVMSQAKCWILDEPLTALDKEGIDIFKKRLAVHVSNQGSVVLSSHQPVDLGRVIVQVYPL